jgi:hypothetical protein
MHVCKYTYVYLHIDVCLYMFINMYMHIFVYVKGNERDERGLFSVFCSILIYTIYVYIIHTHLFI